MNTDRPVVMIHSGQPETDELLRVELLRAFPNLGVHTALGDEELHRHLPDVEVLMAWNFPFGILGAARKLRWLQLLGAGVDSLAGVSLPRDLIVTNIRGVFGVSMAAHTLAYTLAHAKGVREFWQYQEAHQWRPREPALLAGRTVGVAGLGSIGRKIAEYCLALGMEVVGLKRTPEALPGLSRVYTTAEIEEFLPRCDYLVLVMPATRETAHLLNRERFRLLKAGCFLVSIGRGNVMHENDLIDALESGKLAGAAVDVFEQEPLSESSPLWGTKNVHITPHVSGINRAADLLPPVRENLGRFLRGEALSNRVDLEQGY